MHAQAAFTVVGPDGGDARAFASVPGQPNHLYLGTTNSWLYESLDEGATWHRLAKLDRGDGFVLDSIVVDSVHPSTLYVGAWKDTDDGGLWISHDAGHTLHETALFKGQPIHASCRRPPIPTFSLRERSRASFAPAIPAQRGPRSARPAVTRFTRLNLWPSIPQNPDIVYAGTWHLPWKTTDGGKTWRNIKEGLIVDSDVFSIIVNPAHPHIVYLSACSGIYKSENAGALFRKIQGIPTEARRTRVLMQDPENLEVVYAGTTEGLYKTVNGGKTFARMTDSDVMVNDVYVDSANSNRVLLATDRGGVLVSDDAGVTFTPSNLGISERKIAALLVDNRNDRRDPPPLRRRGERQAIRRRLPLRRCWRALAAVRRRARRSRRFCAGRDQGWRHRSRNQPRHFCSRRGPPLRRQLRQTRPAQMAPTRVPPVPRTRGPGNAGTQPSDDPPPATLTSTWLPRNDIANTLLKTLTETHRGTKVNIEKTVKAPTIQLESLVNALDVSGDVWVAATNYGLLTSHDQGATWQGGPVMGDGNFLSVTAHGNDMVATGDDSVVISNDAGQSWFPMGMPTMLTHIHRVVFSPDGTLWLGAREGVYFTRNLGKTWLWFNRLPLRDIDDLSYDVAAKSVLVSSRTTERYMPSTPEP